MTRLTWTCQESNQADTHIDFKMVWRTRQVTALILWQAVSDPFSMLYKEEAVCGGWCAFLHDKVIKFLLHVRKILDNNLLNLHCFEEQRETVRGMVSPFHFELERICMTHITSYMLLLEPKQSQKAQATNYKNQPQRDTVTLPVAVHSFSTDADFFWT